MREFFNTLRSDPILALIIMACFGLVIVFFGTTLQGCKATDAGKNITITLPNLTTEQINQIGKWVKEVQDGKRGANNDSSTAGATGTTTQGSEPTSENGESSVGGSVPNDNEEAKPVSDGIESAEYEGYKNIDRSDFNCCEMIPTYEQLMATDIILPIKIITFDPAGTYLSWDASKIDLTPRSGEEVKAVNIWFKDGKALLFKDWGVNNPPGNDGRWYYNDDLRKDGKKINVEKIPGAQFITCIVGTWQPKGINAISRVIAKSAVVTNG